MLRTPGQTVGHYELVEEVGRGGMGVVFLARDTRLDRRVAIKALPDHLATDPDRLARFEREAKTLAQLNHQHVAGIYGIEEHEGARYLVLEFVEGETLADRLDRGPIDPDEAVEIAGQIANGVAAAHDAGVIHRDLKPANIRITPEGVVKVLDFGLARHDEGASGSSVSPDAATLTSPVQHSPTSPGVILGTAAYMSPEQARGRRVDKRTDTWSFGVVLYEMLTGASPFLGETATDSIGAILHKDPDLSRLPSTTPRGVRRVLARCLDRDKERRYRDLGDVRIELEAALDEPVVEPAQAGRGRFSIGGAVAFAVVAIAIGAGAAWALKPAAPARHVRLSVAAPVKHQMFGRPFISRDGSYILFGAVHEDGGTALAYFRRLDDHVATALEETRGGRAPGFSPSGAWVSLIGPVAERGSQQQLMKWSMDPGLPPVPIAVLPESVAISGYNYVWLNEQTFIFSDSRSNKIRFVDAQSGTMSEAREIDLGDYPGSYDLLLSRVDDTRALCRLYRYSDLGFTEDIGLLDVDRMRVDRIVENSAEARVGPDGSILFTRGSTLYGATFDPDTLSVGPAVQLVAGLRTNGAYVDAQFDIADDGSILFGSGGEQGVARRLVIRQPEGVDTTLEVEPAAFTEAVAVSNDESRALVVVTSPNKIYEIWGTDLDSPRLHKVRGLPTSDLNYPVFASDNDTFVCMRTLDGRTGVEVASYEGRFEPYWLIEPVPEGFLAPVAVHPVTDRVLMMWERPEGFRLYQAELRAGAEPELAFNSSANVVWSDFSPDGSMLAYSSDETGRREVYVRTVRDDGSYGRPVAVTSRGGNGAAWHAAPGVGGDGGDGVTLDLIASTRDGLVVYPISPGESPRVGDPVVMPYTGGIPTVWAPMSGRRLLTFDRGENEAPSRHHEVILNWYETVQALIRKP